MCADYAAAITTTDERGLNIWFCIDGANKYYESKIKLENG
jgi:hypothetical protein